MKFKVLTNYTNKSHLEKAYEQTSINVDFQSFVDRRLFLKKAMKSDIIILMGPTMLEVCLVAPLRLLGKQTYVFDIVLKKPSSKVEKAITLCKKQVLRIVNKFLVLQRDLSGYERYYGIGYKNSTLIDFTANCSDIDNKNTLGYNERKSHSLICGTSQRDYSLVATIAKSNPDINFKIIASNERLLMHADSYDDITTLKTLDNVEIESKELSREQYYDELKSANNVFLPLNSDTIQPAGISVALEAMWFATPVVIAEPAMPNQFKHNIVENITYQDRTKAGNKIKELICNDRKWNELSRAGKQYAISLGDDTRMLVDILNYTVKHTAS